MSLKLSNIARSILQYGLADDCSKELVLPAGLLPLAREIYDVPEKPADFHPQYLTDTFPKVILASGGLDSTVSWLMAVKETGNMPKAFYVHMGQAYAEKELTALSQMGIPVQILKVAPPQHIGDGKWKHIHPGRNFYYLSLVAEQLVEPASLVLSAVDGEISEHGGDKSRRFLDLVNLVLLSQNPPMEVITPLDTMTKADLVTWAKEHDYVDVIKQTISCFANSTGRCGKCQSCLRTWMAFYYNDIKISFDVEPMIGAVEYVTKYKKVLNEALEKGDFSHYSERRCRQDLEAMRKWESEKPI